MRYIKYNFTEHSIKGILLLTTDNTVKSRFVIVHFQFTLHLTDNAGTTSQ